MNDAEIIEIGSITPAYLIHAKGLAETADDFFGKAAFTSHMQKYSLSPETKRIRRFHTIMNSYAGGVMTGAGTAAVMLLAFKGASPIVCACSGVFSGIGTGTALLLTSLHSDKYYNKKAADEFLKENMDNVNKFDDKEKLEFAKNIVEVCSKAISEGRNIDQDFIFEAKTVLGKKILENMVNMKSAPASAL